MCEMATVSRASFYRSWENKAPTQAEMALRDAIQRMAVTHRFYGYRRIAVLVQREDYEVGAKKVRRLMKEDNLLAVQRRKFVATTDSDHGFVVYPNLAEHVIVNDVNQLWVADITYIRLLAEFVYWAVGLDAFSRRAVGWTLGRNLQTSLPLAALENAIRTRQPWVDTSFRPWYPVCEQRLREAAGKYRGGAEHEPASSSLGERAM